MIYGIEVKNTKPADLESGYTNTANPVWFTAEPRFACYARYTWSQPAFSFAGHTDTTDSIWFTADPRSACYAQLADYSRDRVQFTIAFVGNSKTTDSIWSTAYPWLARDARDAWVSIGLKKGANSSSL